MSTTATSMSTMDLRQFASTVSWLCGWLYFFAWSASFYPQPILNLRRRSTQGLMIDFPFLNVFGFTCYTISTALFLFSKTIRRQYALRHPESPEPTVRPNDLAFGVHAVVLCVVSYSQFWPRLWGWETRTAVRRRATKTTLGIFWGSLLGMAIILVIVLAHGQDANGDGTGWAWIDVMYGLSYVKLLLTIFKYVPQAIANFRRKSTIGWSIAQVMLDFYGGILSLIQLFIDSGLQADWSGLVGNPVKLGLANISLIFDLVFICQHYVLYGPVEEERAKDDETTSDSGVDGERQPLIA